LKSRPQKSAPKNSPARWWFRAAAAVCVPLLALAALEAGLRLAHYGWDTSLFELERVDGRDYWMNNEKFSLRFFPPELMRWPSPIKMAAAKPPGACRIFIMGESAAQGDPEPAFGPGRYMEALLRERYPNAEFDIVNAGITAIDSHVILPIARECARHDGDIWIIYMGNNEMVGPFGAATVFGAQAPPLPFVRLNLAMQETRLGQWISAASRRLRGKGGSPAQWGGMQMFLGNQLPPGDPRKARAYANFQANLRDILRAGLAGGAKIVLNTVAVNLKDCAPFAAAFPAHSNAAEAAEFNDDYARGTAAEERGDWAGAADLLKKSVALEPGMADAQFQLGQSLLRLGATNAAREHLRLACDDDALPFRADSKINGAIREEARAMAGPNLALCDAADALAAGQPAGVCGDETFYEHVHFNFDGAYRLGLLWADQAAFFLPSAIKAGGGGSWASEEVCEKRLGVTDWNKADVLRAVLDRMSRPPLSSQSNNAERVRRLNMQFQTAVAGRTADAAKAAGAIYEDAIRRAPGDYYLRENFGEFLELAGDVPEAARQWRLSHELMPRNPFAFLTEGQLLEKMGQAEPARQSLRHALALHPRYAEAWRELGKADALENKLDAALANYRRAEALQPNDPETRLCEGKALSLLKRPPESEASFREALRLNPNYWEAHYALGGELGLEGQFAPARSEFEEVIRLNPGFSMAHLNLGVALLKLKQPDGAEQQFEETLRLDPSNKAARQYLAAAKAAKQEVKVQ
jgi:tetratricopeptide (TPR) repeat protein